MKLQQKNNKLSEFINDFKSTIYYKQIIKQPNIIGIIISGSRSIGAADEESDYDLLILTDDSEYVEAHPIEYLKYNNSTVHWYYYPIQKLLYLEHKITLEYSAMLQVGAAIEKDAIIYWNPQYKSLYMNLKKYHSNLTLLGAYALYFKQSDYIKQCLNNGIIKQNYSKYIYHLCFAAYKILQKNPNMEFLKAVKRIKQKTINNDQKNLILELFQNYQIYIYNNPIDLISLRNKLYYQLFNEQIDNNIENKKIIRYPQ